MKTTSKTILILLVLLMASTAFARRHSVRKNRLSPRITRPIQMSMLFKGKDLGGVEVGLRTIEGHVEFHMGMGSSMIDTIDPTCRQDNLLCAAPALVNWNMGVRWYPLYGGLSPYVSVGVMGPMNVTGEPVALIGGGLHWQHRHGFTANIGIEIASGQRPVEQRVIPTFTLGYAF